MELENLSENNLRWQEASKDDNDDDAVVDARSLSAKIRDMMKINRGMVLVKVVYSLINLGICHTQRHEDKKTEDHATYQQYFFFFLSARILRQRTDN